MSRKTMLMLVGGVAVLISTVALRVSLSGDDRLADRSSDLGSPRNSDEEADDPFGSRTPATAITPPQLRQSAGLRQRFVELTAKRAQRMSDEELGRAVDEITKAIADQDTAAEAELEKASEQLKAVVEKFPGTPSAERANRALDAMKAKPSTGLRRINEEDGDDGELSEKAVPRKLPRPMMPVKKESKR